MIELAHPVARALSKLPEGPLTPTAIDAHIRPLFTRVLDRAAGRVYLANHSLGRPPDAMADDVREATDAWYANLGDAWDAWSAEIEAYRRRLAVLLEVQRADAIVPKTSAGQGLRAVLNAWDRRLRVVATRGEFDSLDIVLREYARRGRIELAWVEPDADGLFSADAVRAAIVPGVDLAVLSSVMFQTGQVLPELPVVVRHAHACGAQVLLDVYHSLGAMPVDLAALDVDFAVGGSYKYMRGGPGACYLYVHPRHLDAGLRTLDVGWFAKASPQDYARPDPPEYAPGGDGWMESTPAILPFYQARAGQLFVQGVGPRRLRECSLQSQQRLVAMLNGEGIGARGGTSAYGAFVTVRDPRAQEWAKALRDAQVIADARGEWLRLCPDVLTTDDELARAARALGRLAGK